MAELAGLGWVGKNTLLLNQRWGSYFFLAALLTDLDLSPDEPSTRGHCGTCTACLDACPTQAFPTAYVLDARRCISYLTIEHRSEIADDLAGQMGGWAFGCDICQEVCPWNRKSALASEVPFEPQEDFKSLDILQILAMNETDFRNRFRRTPLWRPRRRGVLRNAILIAGQQAMVSAVPLLRELASDPEPLIRGAAAWALERLKASASA